MTLCWRLSIGLLLIVSGFATSMAGAQHPSIFAAAHQIRDDLLPRRLEAALPSHQACVALYKEDADDDGSAHRAALSMSGQWTWSLISFCEAPCDPTTSVDGLSILNSDGTRTLAAHSLTQGQRQALASDPSAWTMAQLAELATPAAENLAGQLSVYTTTAWTARIAGAGAWHALVYLMEEGACPAVDLLQSARVLNPMIDRSPPPEHRLEGLYRPSTFRDLPGERHERRLASRAIVRLEIVDPNKLGYCSGVLATDNKIMTAGHCLAQCSATNCSIAIDVDFNTDTAAATTLIAESWGSDLLASGLDFAWIVPVQSADIAITSLLDLKLPWHRRPLASDLVRQNAFLLGHPGGHLQMLAETCGVFKIDKESRRLLHTCTATEGFSGAPLWYQYDRETTPVGIHYVVNPSKIEGYRSTFQANVEYFQERRVHAAVRFEDVYDRFCKLTPSEDQICPLIKPKPEGGEVASAGK